MLQTRHDVINYFIELRNYQSFLEIGTDTGDSLRLVRCPKIVSIDPDPLTPATVHKTSDEYFASTKAKFDVIFIDGLHEHNQVWRDIKHALSHLRKGGVIILHDCHPTNYKMQVPHNYTVSGEAWTGDVWKAYLKARAELPYEIYCIDVDWGCGIIDTTFPKVSYTGALPTDMDAMTYHDDFLPHPEWMSYTKDVIV